MRNIIIRPSDYKDFSEIISEKNIINAVNGKEHIITSIENEFLEPIESNKDKNPFTLNPNTLSKVFTKQPYININARYNDDFLTNGDDAYLTLLNIPIDSPGGIILDHDYARTEALFVKGSYEFTTEKVIDFSHPLSCSFTINYKKVKGGALYGGNQGNYTYVKNKTAFFGHGNEFPSNQENEENPLVDTFLPVQQGKSTVKTLLNSDEAIANIPYGGAEYCTATIIEKTSTTNKIRVDYNFRIWGAWSGENGVDGNTVLAVDTIEIRTFGNKIDTNELPFDYKTNSLQIERNYELETNELFQTTLDTKIEDRLSYQTYKEIVNNYDKDRRIISFDLLNPIKVSIDDTNIYTDGEIQERYLDTNDIFTIYGYNDEYLGDFKVIQCNPIWDGSYHKFITAILLEESPIASVFADNSWATIATIFKEGKASDYWQVGDTKPIEIDGVVYNVRIADMEIGRYNYSNSNRKSNGVFEFVELMPNPSVMNQIKTKEGGYSKSYLRNTTINEIWNILPQELKRVISPIELPSYNGGTLNDTLSVTYSSEKIFIPSLIELGTSISAGNDESIKYEDGSIFDYYLDAYIKPSIRSKNNGYWTRTHWFTSSSFNLINVPGNTSGDFANSSHYISLFFAI